MVALKRATPDVRGAVLLAATRLFAQRGFDGTALQDVADVVGVSKPAVLHHFASKEALRAAVLEAMLVHWRDRLPRLLLAATASLDRFQAVYGELHRFFADDPDRARLLLRELLDRPEAMKRVMKGAVRPWLDAVAGYIHQGQKAGRHHQDVDAEAYVGHVMLLVVASAAAQDVTSALLEGDALRRADQELARLTRSALFSSPVKSKSSPKRPKSRSTAR